MMNRRAAAVTAAIFLLGIACIVNAQEVQENEFTEQFMTALDEAENAKPGSDDESSNNHTQAFDVRFSSPVIARQGNAVVTQSDLEVFMSRMEEEHHSAFLRNRDRVGQALSNLMLPRLLAEHARKEGFLENADLQAKLFQSATVLIGQEYMRHHYRSRELENYSNAARELYLVDPDQFRSPADYDFTHILVKVGQERGELDAMRRVSEIYERLKDGASVSELVSDYSDDPRAEDNNGAYKGAELSQLDESVAQAIELMEPGQISEPVRSVYGWHVIQLNGIQEGRQLEWEEAEPEALERARERHFTAIRERLVQDLKQSDVSIRAQNLESFLKRYDVSW